MARTVARKGVLADERVAIAGRLATCNRRAAVRLIADQGGQFCRQLGAEVTLLVVGGQGWPLSADGRVAGKLRRARQLIAGGQGLVIVGEDEFMRRVAARPATALYSLAELAQILGLPADRLKTWFRAGLIRPVHTDGGANYFDFAEAARAKSIHDLLERGIHPSRLRQSLARLEQWFGTGGGWQSQLAILERFGRVVVRLPGGGLAEPTGQMRFDFAEEASATLCAFPAQAPSAGDWLARGRSAADRGDYAEATTAYRRALASSGPAADTCFELGNVLYLAGRRAAAAERFRQALELDPGLVEAWNNLGTALHELDESDEALEAYRRALEIDPHFADAHFNLADALDDLGRRGEAREHWQAYLRYDNSGQWAEYARERLAVRKPR